MVHWPATGAHQPQLLVADINNNLPQDRGGQRVNIYSSNTYMVDYLYGITNPRLLDDALKTMEKLNLYYFELFFSKNKLVYICSQWNKWTE
jgi:hypothetical protein